MIRVLKLVTGEDIISEIKLNPESDTMTLSNPASIVLQRTESGVGVGLAQFMAYSEGDIILNETSVVGSAEPAVQLRNEYSKLFGSGIQLMSSSLNI